MRLFYYLIAAPALFLLRVLFWPFKTIFRFAGRFHSWRKARRRFRRADYDDMDGWEFEEYVGELLARDGFIHVEVTRGSGDQGVDVLAERLSLIHISRLAARLTGFKIDIKSETQAREIKGWLDVDEEYEEYEDFEDYKEAQALEEAEAGETAEAEEESQNE